MKTAYTLLRQLGEGDYGEVYLARNQAGGLVAIKKPICEEENLFHEKRVLMHLHAQGPIPGIPAFIESVRLPGDAYQSLVMEYIDGKNLLTLYAGTIPATQMTSMISQFLTIISHIHTCHITHRDLTSRNILLTSAGHLAVVDYGRATLPSQTKSRAFCTETEMALTMARDWFSTFTKEQSRAGTAMIDTWYATLLPLVQTARVHSDVVLASWEAMIPTLFDVLPLEHLGGGRDDQP